MNTFGREPFFQTVRVSYHARVLLVNPWRAWSTASNNLFYLNTEWDDWVDVKAFFLNFFVIVIVRTVFAVRMAKTEEPTSSTCTGNKEGGDDMSSSPSAASNRDKEVDAHQHEPPAQNSLITASKQNMFPRYADHTYHDFAAYLKDGGRIEKHKKSDRNFPARLHVILSDEQYSHIIAWMPHGRAWKVLNKTLLVDEALPKFFGQSKFASFTRQLSGWGFKRLHNTGPDVG
eukprot:scaffold120_cov134-Skeletonema_dohrnii-CCMP3373.AAC.7